MLFLRVLSAPILVGTNDLTRGASDHSRNFSVIGSHAVLHNFNHTLNSTRATFFMNSVVALERRQPCINSALGEDNTEGRVLRRQAAVRTRHKVERSVVPDDVKEDPEVSISGLVERLGCIHLLSLGYREVLIRWGPHVLTDSMRSILVLPR